MEDMEPTRHETLYFPDGNIVICSSGAGTDRVLFRVHKSILSFHSPVFKDMFTLPSIEGVNETYDDAPLVSTTDDAKGWEEVLGFLYQTEHPMNPDNLRPAMTLAMKYNIISIKDDIVAKMMADWPSSLHEWDDWEYGIQQLQTRYDHFCESIRDHVPEPASAIRFALDFHIPAILPAAFYVLSRTDVMHDWYQDGNDEYKCWGNWRYSARWKDLSAQDLLCLIRGQRSMLGCWQKLDLAWEKMYPDLPPEVGPECTCSDAKGESTWQKIMSSVRDCSDIFHKLKELSSEDAIEGDACGLCKTVMTWAIQRSRRQLWDQLPSVFSLDQLIDH